LAKLDSRRYRKDLRRIGRQHDGDCASWSGSISCFVKSFQTAKLSGLVGQSPLPVSQTARLFGQIGQSPLPERSAPNWRATRWRLRFVVGLISCFVKSSQTARLSGLVGQSPLPERSAPNWRATRWRLRFVVGVDQLLREIFSDRQTLRPGWTVAATGKICAELAGNAMATALFGRGRSVASRNLLRLPDSPAWFDSRRCRFDWMILFRFDDLSW
jgi:hypothetical protein